MEKVDLKESEIKDMKSLLEKDPSKFKEYAINDAKIVLIHGCFMDDFNFSVGGVGTPITISSLSSKWLNHA
jgi:hypothetical protein